MVLNVGPYGITKSWPWLKLCSYRWSLFLLLDYNDHSIEIQNRITNRS